MRPGSVIVDLAVERGGNCELARPGEVVVTDNHVKIVGHLNVAGRLAATASQLYAKNLFAFLETMIDKESKALKVDGEDELVKATRAHLRRRRSCIRVSRRHEAAACPISRRPEPPVQPPDRSPREGR